MILKEKLALLRVRYAADPEALRMLEVHELFDAKMTELQIQVNASLLKSEHALLGLENLQQRTTALETPAVSQGGRGPSHS